MDPGYEIQTPSGTDLSKIVKVEGNVNSSIVGSYRLTYKATYNGVSKELIRIVHVVNGKISDYISELYKYKPVENGLINDNTEDKNIRYSGSNINNYVEFGNTDELWRIIGIFEVTTGSGNIEKLVKIVRNDSLGNMPWDSSDANNGFGINQWGPSTYENGSAYEGADLMLKMNDSYLNRTGEFSTTGINDLSDMMIETVVWHTGALDDVMASALTAYNAERGEITGKICTSGTECNDSVTRTTTWTGAIGLIYLSDYGYASANKSCRVNMGDDMDLSCDKNNWLHNNTHYWTMTPSANPDFSRDAHYVSAYGYMNNNPVSNNYNIRPSLYLKSNVVITDGDGTQSNPYKLSM